MYLIQTMFLGYIVLQLFCVYNLSTCNVISAHEMFIIIITIIIIIIKVKQPHYMPKVPRGFQEVQVPRFHDNGTGWW